MCIHAFFLVCILVRLVLSYLTQIPSLKYPLSFFYFMLGAGLVYVFLTNKRKKGSFGQEIWWHQFRPLHALIFLYVGFTLSTNYKDKNKERIKNLLLFDTLVGVIGYFMFSTLWREKDYITLLYHRQEQQNVLLWNHKVNTTSLLTRGSQSE